MNYDQINLKNRLQFLSMHYFLGLVVKLKMFIYAIVNLNYIEK